jgi:hypothetical protein
MFLSVPAGRQYAPGLGCTARPLSFDKSPIKFCIVSQADGRQKIFLKIKFCASHERILPLK